MSKIDMNSPPFKHMIFMSEDQLNDLVKHAFKNKDKNRLKILEYAIRLGLDVNGIVLYTVIPWLFYAVEMNDLILLGYLIKHGANIHITHQESDNNIIHYCIIRDNLTLLKHFVKLGVDYNHVNDFDDSPLELAFIGNKYEIIKYLLQLDDIVINHEDDEFDDMKYQIDILDQETSYKFEGMFDVFDVFDDDESFSPLNDIMLTIIENNDDKPIFLDILQLIINKTKRLDHDNAVYIKHLMKFGKNAAFKIIINKFPKIINLSLNGYTIFNKTIEYKNVELIDYMLDQKCLKHNKTSMSGDYYIHLLTDKNLTTLTRKFLNKFPDDIHLKTLDQNRTPLDTCIINLDTYSEDITEMIDLLVEYKIDINHENNLGIRSIESAIQFRNVAVVEKMIDLGANIHGPLKNATEFPAICNNDLITFAVQNGKIDIVKLLINKGAPLHTITKQDNIVVHTSVLSAIMWQWTDILKYLFQLDPIKQLINDNVMAFLLDYAVNIGITDENIFKFLSMNKVDRSSIDIMNDKFRAVSYEKLIGRFINYYDFDNNEKMDILVCLQNMYILLKESSQVGQKNLYKLSNYAESVINSLHAANINIGTLLTIISSTLNGCNMEAIKDAIIYAHDIDDDIQSHLRSKYINQIKNNASDYKEKISLIKGFITIIQSLINKYKNEDQTATFNKSSIKVVRADANENNKVIKALFKLYFPVKQKHYDYMYDSLINNNDIISISDDKLTVTTSNDVKSIVFKTKNGIIPPKWINTYASNIGSEQKDDYNHSFSFLLDKELEKWPCIMMNSKDPLHKGGSNTLLYFHGVIQYGKHIETGCYEYFLNSNGTLFHRLFRPYNSLPANIRKQL